VPLGRQTVRFDTELLRLLSTYLQSDDDLVRARCTGTVHNLSVDIGAIKFLREADCLQFLVTLLKDPSIEICQAAVSSLQNISRETLQHNVTLEKIKASITKRVLSELKKKKDDSIEEYLKFWTNFGAALKEGLCEANTDPEKLLEVCMFRSSIHNKMISLDEYINNYKEDQKTIYYLSGEDSKKLLTSQLVVYKKEKKYKKFLLINFFELKEREKKFLLLNMER
jgi:hypothetical protein